MGCILWKLIESSDLVDTGSYLDLQLIGRHIIKHGSDLRKNFEQNKEALKSLLSLFAGRKSMRREILPSGERKKMTNSARGSLPTNANQGILMMFGEFTCTFFCLIALVLCLSRIISLLGTWNVHFNIHLYYHNYSILWLTQVLGNCMVMDIFNLHWVPSWAAPQNTASPVLLTPQLLLFWQIIYVYENNMGIFWPQKI